MLAAQQTGAGSTGLVFAAQGKDRGGFTRTDSTEGHHTRGLLPGAAARLLLLQAVQGHSASEFVFSREQQDTKILHENPKNY